MRIVRSILLLQLIAILFSIPAVTAAVPEDQLELQIHEINDTNIDQMITTDSEWLLVLSAPWCSACKRFKKDFIQLKEKLEDEPLDRLVQLGSVNTDDNTNIASRFYLTYLPSIYHIKNRQVRLLDYGLPVLRHSQYANRDADSLYNFLKNNIYEKIDQWSYVFNPWSVFGVFLGFLGTLVGLLQKGVKAVAESSPYLSQAGVWFGLFIALVLLTVALVLASTYQPQPARTKKD
ncbi:hypothetical protein MP638_001212 [Amoeboaphelidium occidentale]|nr:hypothetical protein MP638_001212 [Amoeboaphelidium occidentale]